MSMQPCACHCCYRLHRCITPHCSCLFMIRSSTLFEGYTGAGHTLQHSLPFVWCRIFQQQFCQAGKPVVVRGVKPGFLWDPDTLQRATINLKGMYGHRKDKSAAKVQQKMPTPLTVSLLPSEPALPLSQLYVAFPDGVHASVIHAI